MNSEQNTLRSSASMRVNMRVLPSLDKVVTSLRASGVELPSARLGLGCYGDSEKQSDFLVSLICEGKKRATSTLLWAHAFDGEELPQVGDVEIVIDYGGSPAAVISITAVYVLPFDAVPAEFAAEESEADGSLEKWRREHWNFFERECRRIGQAAEESMPVVCCGFELREVIAERRGSIS